MHRGPQQCRDLGPGVSPDLLDVSPLVADHDPLLGLPLHDQGGDHVQQRAVGGTIRALAHLDDLHRDGVRQFLANPLQRGLADQLGDQGLGRLLGDLPLGVIGGPLGQQRDEGLAQLIDLLPGHRRAGHDVLEVHPQLILQCGDRGQVLHQTRVGDQIGLGGHRHQRRAVPQLGDLAHQEGVAGPDPLIAGQADADHVDLRPGAAHHVVEPLAQQGAGLVQPRGVDDHQLGVLGAHHPADDMPGGLRLVGGDRDPGTDQGIGEGGLAGIGPSHEAHEAGVEAGPGGLGDPRGHVVGVGEIVLLAGHQIGQRRRRQILGGIIGGLLVIGGGHLAYQVGVDLVTPSGRLLGGDLDALPDHRGAGDRDHRELLGHQPADGVDVLVIGLDVEQLGQIPDRHPRGDPEQPGFDLLGLGRLGVVLVDDLADDLLDDVLDGRQPGRATELVDHDDDVVAVPLHLTQYVVDRLGVGDVDRLAHHQGDLLDALSVRIVLDSSGQILEVDDALDVIEALPHHRQPGESRPQCQRDRLAQGLVLLDEDDIGTRHHHLAQVRVSQLEDRVDHLALVGLDEIGGLGVVDHVAQLGLGGERALGESAPRRHGIADRDEGCHQRPQHRRGDQPDPPEEPAHGGVVLFAEGARGDPPQDVADHQHDRRDHHDPFPGRAEVREQAVGDQDDGGDLAADPHHHRGVDETSRVLGHRQHPGGAASAVGGRFLGPADRHVLEGGLAGGDQEGDHCQNQRDRQLHPLGFAHRVVSE